MASNVQQKLLLEAAQHYAQEISPEALAALGERGISEVVAARYMLGTVTDPINGHELHEGWISIPYITALGHCVGFNELDTIIASGVLGIPAVGVPGVQAWKSHYPKLFSGYETIYVIGDNDIKEDGTNPGAEFAKRVANEVINSVIVTLPPGMDINDYYLAHGDVATRALLTGERNE